MKGTILISLFAVISSGECRLQFKPHKLDLGSSTLSPATNL